MGRKSILKGDVMKKEYKIITHKMESISNKLKHFNILRKDYSSFIKAFEIEMSVASQSFLDNIEKVKKEFN